MPVTILAVSDRRTKRMFVEAAAVVQHPGSSWVRPLDSIVTAHLDQRHNPFYKTGQGQGFVALSDDKPVGRILAHASPRQQLLTGCRVGCFGLFEAIDNADVARLLLDVARTYLREQNCTEMAGPFNITAAQEMGVVVEGFDRRPSIDMVYNPPWYDRLLQECGLQRCLQLRTWRCDDVSNLDVNTLVSDAKQTRLDEASVTVRSLDRRRKNHDMEAIRELTNSAFLGNWGFVPIDRAEWNEQVGPLTPILDPELIQLAEVMGVAVGVTLAVPDFNLVLAKTGGRLVHPAALRLLSRKPLRDAAVILFAVRKSHQGLGISRRLNQELIRKMQQRGYRGLSVTWIASANKASQAQVEALGAKPLHEVAMYHQPIGEPA